MKKRDCANSFETLAGFESHNETALVPAFEMNGAIDSTIFTDFENPSELGSHGYFFDFKQKGATNEVKYSFSALESSLELDLEFQALAIISSSDNMKDYFNKYNQCYSLILSLAYSNKTVMYTFAGWLLSINQLPVAEKFLKQSTKLFELTESNLLSSNEDFVGDITGVIVSRTCHALIASSKGDYASWRKIFEKIYKLLDQLGIEEAFGLFQDNPFACWVLGWFFYQDIFKLGRLSNREVFGPLFSKNTYKKLIEVTAYSKIKNPGFPAGCGPLTRCCSNLYITMGEVNTLYDLFAVKLQELNKYKEIFINPIIENKSISRNNLTYFLDSDIYKKYDSMKKHFYSWFNMKVGVLEEKICHTEPNLDIPGLTDDQKNRLNLFHDILKISLQVFLKVRILGCSTANLQIKLLREEIVSGLHKLVAWELNNYLLFPFLIAGTSVHEEVDKLRLKKLYCELKTRLKSGNLEKVWEMIKNVWDSYDDKDKVQNTGDLLSVIDCDVCVF